MPRHPFLRSIPSSRQLDTRNNSSTVLTPSEYTMDTPAPYSQPYPQLSPGNVTFSQDAANSDRATTIWMIPAANQYFRLSQLLQGEIWAHNQTRTELQAEIERRDNALWKRTEQVSEWSTACQEAYAALDQHRMEEEQLHEEIQSLKSEIEALNAQVISAGDSKSDAAGSKERGSRTARRRKPHSGDGKRGQLPHYALIQDIEQHLREQPGSESREFNSA